MDAARPAGAYIARAPAITEAAHAAIMPLATGLLCYAAVAQGGFYRTAGSFFAAGLAACALATPLAGIGPLIGSGVLLCGGLGIGTLASGSGSNAPQIVASLGAALAIVPVVRRIIASGERERMLATISWIGAAASVVGMLGVAFHRTPWAAPASGLWRSASTLTYANAAGSLFVLAAAAAALVLIERSTPARRVAAFLIVTGLATTLSRGAVVAAIVSVATLAVLRRVELLRALVRPACGAVLSLLFFIPSITGAAQPALALAGLFAGGVIATGSRAWSRNQAIVVLAVVAVAGAFAASSGAGRVFERRALPASETRLRTWGAVWDQAMNKPLAGHGPGTFSIVENDPKRGPVLTRYVHNEYLQVLFETGAAGLAAVGGATLVLARWVWRRRRSDPAWALAAASCAGFAVHSGIDFLWRFPLLVALAFLWLAVAVTPPSPSKETS